jgi:Fe-S cluster assembly protein SufB
MYGAREGMQVRPWRLAPVGNEGTMSDILIDRPELESLGNYEFGWSDSDVAGASAKRGISPEVVKNISALKNEPEWMLKNRLKGLAMFLKKPLPSWGADLSGIDFDNIKYFVRSTEQQAEKWEDLPDDIKNTYERLGIPEAERKNLIAGVTAQYESEVVYHQIRSDLEEQGVIFTDTDTGLREHPEFFEEYFGTIIPAGDNKFAALNTAAWSGGSFVYVPPGVHVEIPLQAYFRINTENMGQFERTLIIADEGSYVHYIEGCTAPTYSSDSLHSAVVEIVVKKNARVRYTTIQNWSNNVYNLVTKRAMAHEGATMEWVDGNLGSKVTMKYPSIYLVGEHAKGETLSVAFAGPGQHQDAGAKMIHMAPYTQSSIVSKSIARGGGRSGYRGEVRIAAGAHHSANTVRCDALLVDTMSRSDTYPTVDIREDEVQMGHEATVTRVSAEQLFYLMSRGMPEDEAMAMIVRGFIEPISRELPMEYALELNKLIEMGMEGSVG